MKKRSRVLIILSVVLLLSFAALQYYFHSSLPEISGKIDTGTLNTEAEITRSHDGYTHIIAESDEDAFFAQGFAHAQDRMWQMELMRKLVSGRICEVIGEGALSSDIYYRTVGFYKLSEKSWKESEERTKKLFEAYSRGVNAWLKQQKTLPPEFLILGEPEPWSPVDSVAMFKTLTQSLGANSYLEVIKTWIMQNGGVEDAEEQFPTYQKYQKRILKKDEIDNSLLTGKSYTERYPQIIEELKSINSSIAKLKSGELNELAMTLDSLEKGLAETGILPGSNNWAISGRYTESGKPILANDPHMGASIPAVFYLNEIKGDVIAVNGVTVPGIPGILLGRNKDIAWSVTTFRADTQDYYMEKVQDNQYYYMGEWHELEISEELISVKGLDEPYKLQIRKTPHGPLMDQVVDIPGITLSLKWTINHVKDTTHEALLSASYARNWEEFKKSITKVTAPLLNFVYADSNDNIGYLAYGKIPVRKKGYGSTFTPGWTDEYEWEGYIPYEELPQIYNPAKGYIVTANQYNFPDEHKHYLGTFETGTNYRGERLNEIIEAHISSGKKFNKETMIPIQLDYTSRTYERFVKEVLKIKPATERQKEIFTLLSQWDGKLNKESSEATILHYWIYYLKDFMDGDRYKPAESESYLNKYLVRLDKSRVERAVTAMEEGDLNWLDDPLTPEKEDSHMRLLEALDMAVAHMEDKSGKDIEDWQWGTIHKVMYNHAIFGKIPLVKNMFNREVEAGGSTDTVNMAIPDYEAEMKSSHVPTMRLIYDMANLDGNYMIVPTGQSAHFKSPYYDNLLEKFYKGEYLDHSLSDRKIEGQTLYIK